MGNIKLHIIFLLSLLHMGCNPSNEMVNPEDIYPTEKFGFSQAIKANGFLFSSGQVGWNKEYQLIGEGSFSEQAKQAFKNIELLLHTKICTFEDVVLIRIYVKGLDATKRKVVGEILSNYFPTAYKPASSLIGVAALAREDLQIEIEIIANTKNK